MWFYSHGLLLNTVEVLLFFNAESDLEKEGVSFVKEHTSSGGIQLVLSGSCELVAVTVGGYTHLHRRNVRQLHMRTRICACAEVVCVSEAGRHAGACSHL